MTPDPLESAEDAARKFGKSVEARIYDLVEMVTKRLASVSNEPITKSEIELARALQGLLISGGIHGAKSALDKADSVAGEPIEFSGAAPTGAVEIPHVPNAPAIRALMRRDPRLARSAGEVAKIYNDRVVFALARSASATITERVRDAMLLTPQAGVPLRSVSKIVAELGDFTASYAEMVVRTNLNTAVTTGLFSQVVDPAVAEVIGALRFTAVGDSDTRPNHRAADGLIADARDPVWHKIAPPLGYRCRCTVEFMPWTQIPSGLIVNGKVRPASLPAGAHADEGFQHVYRPDIAAVVAA